MTIRKFTPPEPGQCREYRTRSGKTAWLYRSGADLWIGEVDGKRMTWFPSGCWSDFSRSEFTHALDLFDLTPTTMARGWLNIYPLGIIKCFSNKAAADLAQHDRIAVCEINLTVENGKILFDQTQILQPSDPDNA